VLVAAGGVGGACGCRAPLEPTSRPLGNPGGHAARSRKHLLRRGPASCASGKGGRCRPFRSVRGSPSGIVRLRKRWTMPTVPFRAQVPFRHRPPGGSFHGLVEPFGRLIEACRALWRLRPLQNDHQARQARWLQPKRSTRSLSDRSMTRTESP
jgi:hypothetical protein